MMTVTTSPESIGNLSDGFFARLIEFYQRSKAYQPGRGMWNEICRAHQQTLLSSLESRNAIGLKNELARLYSGGSVWGLDDPNPLNSNRDADLARWQEWLVINAIGLGILPAWSDELHQRSRQAVDHASVYSQIKEAFCSLDCAKVGCRTGVECCGDFIPSKMWQYVWPWKTTRLLLGGVPKRVLEIGGGLGGFAQLAVGLGVERHVIIDLPSTAVMAAFLLSAKIGEDAVWLEGEKETDWRVAFFVNQDADAIKSLAPFDIAFNMDSMPEIPTPELDRYLALIESLLKNGGYFLSINHEFGESGVPVVRRKVTEKSHLKTVSRNPFPVREGYVEELWVK